MRVIQQPFLHIFSLFLSSGSRDRENKEAWDLEKKKGRSPTRFLFCFVFVFVFFFCGGGEVVFSFAFPTISELKQAILS